MGSLHMMSWIWIPELDPINFVSDFQFLTTSRRKWSLATKKMMWSSISNSYCYSPHASMTFLRTLFACMFSSKMKAHVKGLSTWVKCASSVQLADEKQLEIKDVKINSSCMKDWLSYKGFFNSYTPPWRPTFYLCTAFNCPWPDINAKKMQYL